MPQACALTRTWPRPGDGISRSTISKSPPAFGTCATFIFAMCVCLWGKSMRGRLFDATEKVAGTNEFRLVVLGQRAAVRNSAREVVPHSEGLAPFGTRLRRLGLRADRKDSYTGHPVL